MAESVPPRTLPLDGITQEELVAFQKEDVDKITADWMVEWCDHGRDFALGEYAKKLRDRSAKLTQLNQPDREETPTTEKDFLDGIKKLAQDWGQRQMRNLTGVRDRIGRDRGSRLWGSLRRASAKV